MRFFYKYPLLAMLAYTSVGAEITLTSDEAKSEEASLGNRPSVVLSPAKEGEKPPSSLQKSRAHFAGARRPPPGGRVKKSSRPKRSKSPWFSSKTHPKLEKRDELESEVTSLPETAPYFIKRPVLHKPLDHVLVEFNRVEPGDVPLPNEQE